MDPISTTAVIVGAGFGGLAMAVELRRAGVRDFVVLERAADVGGVWRENTYPGSGCDVPVPLYSFSFARRYPWPRRYAEQPDIHAYLRHVARRYGVLEHIRFRTEVARASFDEASGRWHVRSTDGQEFSARVFIPATGQLSRPAVPDIPGRESFRGTAFHSARWEHDCELSGKRVAVIGTGASAIQFVPRIQPLAAKLTVFQRTPPYVLPKHDHAYDERYRAAFRLLPFLPLLDRFVFWLYTEFAQVCFGTRRLLRFYELRARQHLRRTITDRRMRRRLTPGYRLGCKRVLFSNDYLPALTAPNTELVTEPITAITRDGVRTADGAEHPADVLIYGTGFATHEPLTPMTITGLGATSLTTAWRDGARAHLGITVPGFPNLFLMYGPNTNLGGGSIVHMLESQARYIRGAVRTLLANPGRYLDVRKDAEARWDAEVQSRLARSVWTGCTSWYRRADGRIVANWPGRTHEYRLRTRRPKPADFTLRAVTRAGGQRPDSTEPGGVASVPCTERDQSSRKKPL